MGWPLAGVLERELFLAAFIAWYRGALQSDAALQEAFIRKLYDLGEQLDDAKQS